MSVRGLENPGKEVRLDETMAASTQNLLSCNIHVEVSNVGFEDEGGICKTLLRGNS